MALCPTTSPAATGEIGIRMALGAQRGAGVPIALGGSKLVESFLFGMKPNNPLALILAVGMLLGAALLAGYVPARKAS